MRWHESDAAHWVVDGGRGVLPRVFKVPMLENGPFYPCFFLHPRACVWLKSACAENQGRLTLGSWCAAGNSV